MNSRRVLRFIWPCIASAFVVIGAHNATAQTPTNTFPNNGNAGIGTTSPSTDLHISSSSPTRGIAQIIGASGSTGVQIQLTQGGVDDWAFGQPAGVSAFSIWSGRALGSNGTERFRIDNNGNIGIGTTSPGVALDIGGIPIAANNSKTIRIAALTGGYYYGAGLEGGFDGSGSGFTRLHTYHSGIDYTILYGNSSGNVGIGTTSPLAKFHVEGLSGSYTGYFHGLSTTSQSLGVLIDAGTNSSDYPLRVRSYNSADYFAIRGDGNVGIGTSSPQGNLDVAAVNPTVNVVGSSHSSFDVIRGTTSNYANIRLGTGTAASYTEDWSLQTRADHDSGNQFSITRAGSITSTFVINKSNGYVGIGTSSPTALLEVSGDVKVSGNISAKYQDVAEWVPASEKFSAGTVVVLDSTKSNQVTSSTVSYDTRVAGVVSEQPGIALGEKSESKVLVGTTGRVRVKVDASKGAIHIGDLLVTSDIPGVAMKSEPVNLGGVQIHRPGTLIGKALEPLEKGRGEILVLLSLQ